MKREGCVGWREAHGVERGHTWDGWRGTWDEGR